MNIKEASQVTGLTADTIRYYERIGLLPPVARTKAGIRQFSERDLAILDFIHCFRSAGMSIDSLLAYMGLVVKGDESLRERQRILQEEKVRLEQERAKLDRALQRLDGKLVDYEASLAKLEGQLFQKEGKE